MKAIIDYLMNMLPFIVIAIPIYAIVRGIILYARKKKLDWRHEVFLLIFALFVVALASQTVIPQVEFGASGFKLIENNRVHKTNLVPFRFVNEIYTEAFINGNFNYFVVNFLGNVLIFVPIGFFVPLLWKLSNVRVVAIGFGTSLFIELCQLFLARGTDIDDVILNTAGTALGLLAFKLLKRIINAARAVRKGSLI